MKKLFTLFLLALLPLVASAYDAEIDGIYYNLYYMGDVKSAEVTNGSNQYSGDIVIPESVSYGGVVYKVTSIGGWAFSGCSDLTSITIPNGVTSIEACAFYNCFCLYSVNIPNSVTYIGWDVFSGTAWYNTQPDGIVYAGKVLYSYKGSMPEDTNLSIEEGTLGIAGYAFRNCTNLSSVTIPEGVKSIGYGAFQYCSGLVSVTFPNSVTDVRDYAFSGTAWYDNQPDGVLYIGKVLYTYKGTMPEGTNYIIEDGTVTIARYAFSNCVGLTSVTIPKSVTNIGYAAFYGCSSLTSVHITDIEAWCHIKFDGSSSNPLMNAHHLFLNGEEVSDFAIPNSVTIIDNSAFSGWSGLTSVTIPNSVSSIGDYAFFGCSGLTSIIIPNSVTSIDDYAFSGCSGLTSVTIPNSVTSIGSSAFSGCSGLTSIAIPNSVTSIGSSAFSDCSGLTSIVIPNSINNIGEYAFSGTSWYDNQPDGIVYAGKVIYSYKGTMPEGTNLIIEEGTLGITSAAFSGCSGLTSITIPSTVISIGSRVFFNCSDLTSIIIDDGNTIYDSRNNCNAVIETASETLIGGCKNSIIPYGVKIIDNYAFWNCRGLTSVIFPNSVTSIGDRAFQDCADISSLTIGKGLNTIANYAFFGCINLSDIYCYADNFPGYGMHTFSYYDNYDERDDYFSQLTLHVPASLLEEYKSKWSPFRVIVPIEEYTLTYKVDGEVFKTYLEAQGAPITPEEVPTKDGYKFSGWSEIPETMPSEDVTITGTFMPLTIEDLDGYVLIAEKDWAGVSDDQLPWIMFSDPANGSASGSADGIEINVTNDVGQFSLPLASVLEGFPLEESADYMVVVTAKLPCDGQVQLEIWSETSVNLQQSFLVRTIGDFQQIIFGFPDCPGEAGNAMVLFECGNFVGTSVLKKVQVYMKGNGSPDDNSFIKSGITYEINGTETVKVSFADKTLTTASIPTTVSYYGKTYRVTSIGNNAFDGCSSLTSMTIHNNMVSIGDYAFSGCSGLTSLILGKSLSSIGEAAFTGCSSLETIKSQIRSPFDLEINTFDEETYNRAELIVLPGTKSAYQSKTGWRNFSHITGNDFTEITHDGYALIAEKDWSGVTDDNLPFIMFPDPANSSASGSADGVVVTVTEDIGQVWMPTAMILEGVDLEENESYKVVITAKLPCDGNLQFNMGDWGANFQYDFPVETTGEFQQIECEFPDFGGDIIGAHVLLGCGNFVGTIIVKKVQIYMKVGKEPIKISSAQQVPYCSDKNLDFTNMKELKAYVATGYDKSTGTIWLTRVNQVPANTGFLLIGEADDYVIPVIDDVSDVYYKNMFKGTLEGTTIQTTDGDYTNYYLSDGASGVGFYKVTKEDGVKVGANRCYLPILTEIPANGSTGDTELIKVSAAKQVPYYTSKNLDFSSLDAQGVKAYTATGYNYSTGVIWLTRVKKVPAQTGILVMADVEGDYNVPTTSVQSVYENMFVGSETAQTIYTNEEIGGVDYVNYYLSKGDAGVGFYKVTNPDGVKMGANRCYLPIPKRDTASGARGKSGESSFCKIILSDESNDDVIAIPLFADDATGIEFQSSIFNLQSNEVYYNLQGQRVENPGKGVFIKNGKKVVIR